MLKNLISVKSLVILVALTLLCCFMLPYYISADDVTNEDKGFVNIEDFGATKDDSTDDTAAFEAAIATGKGIYVPVGRFVVSKPIVIEDRIIRGVSSGASMIEGTMPSAISVR